ncbi:hypothetical protein RclHR1_20440003 [Rhizophagus clarus]|uniref:Uncharacterized protein n=1 Tax=Rhizophagus clarus TaxID=94130 RepID=A0A2Z6QRM6_9GLOM|nr:hypothetical protein RclHR1_20440003 [Rhizophagus clarus]
MVVNGTGKNPCIICILQDPTEVLRANKEYNERRNAENAKLKTTIEELKSKNAEFRDKLAKVKQKQMLNDNTSNNNSSNFNLIAVPEVITVPTEKKEMDNFLLETHKKIVNSEINHKKKSVEKIAQVINNGIQDNVKYREPISSGCSLRKPFHETEILAIACYPKCSSSLLDLTKLFDKALDAKYRTKKANKEKILCWVNFGKKFIVHFSELVKNSNDKIGEKKAKDIIYDEMLEQLVTIRKKKSKEIGIQLSKISRSSLTRRTQSPNSILELTNDQIQEIIDNFSKNPNTELPDDHKASIIDSEGKILDDQSNATEAVSAEVSISLEAIDDYYKMILEECVKDCEYFDKEIDFTSQLMKETNERTPDITDITRNYEKEQINMPDDSNDDEYGGYNEYGECDKGYYCHDGGYERKTSLMINPIIFLLELESLELDNEKESKIKEFCAKYNYAYILLDIDKDGYMRRFLILESITYCIVEKELKKFGKTLIVCIGNKNFYCAQIYLGGSGELYILLNDEPLKVLYNYKDIGIRNSDLFQNTNY